MRLVMSKNRSGRKTIVPCRVVGAIVAAVLMLTLWAGSASAGNGIFLECEGLTSGDLAAESIGNELFSLIDPADLANYPDGSLVLSYHEGGQSTPSDGGGGSGAGTFLHGGLTVVRPVARSSPRFWKMMAIGTVIPKCTLYFTRQSAGSNTTVEYLKIEIQTVFITQIEPRAVAQLEAPGTGRSHLEAITFTFSRIKWDSTGIQGGWFEFDIESGQELK